jgi:hypothetical protein
MAFVKKNERKLRALLKTAHDSQQDEGSYWNINKQRRLRSVKYAVRIDKMVGAMNI